jgi:hypothetical protein
MASVPGRRIGSSADQGLTRLKRELVLSLYTRRGRFWEGVRDLRATWMIESVTERPPPGEPTTLYPEPRPDAPEPFLWTLHLEDIKGCCVPPRYNAATDWQAFLSLCALRDPPDDGLLIFAEYGGEWPETVPEQDEGGPRSPEMLAPPVWFWPNPFSYAAIIREFYEALIAAIGDRHLAPRGIDIHEMYREVVQNTEVSEKMREKDRLPLHSLVEVDENTTQDDLRNAIALLVEAQVTRPTRGRPERDRLTAVECAVLHDEHGWSFRRLAERFGWDNDAEDYTLVTKYVREGRHILDAEG